MYIRALRGELKTYAGGSRFATVEFFECDAAVKFIIYRSSQSVLAPSVCARADTGGLSALF